MYPNGDVYVGKHRNGIKHGDGEYHYVENNIKYSGAWFDNKKHGKGQMVFGKENDATFMGVFEDDSLKTGEYTDALGNVFKSQRIPEDIEYKRIE